MSIIATLFTYLVEFVIMRYRLIFLLIGEDLVFGLKKQSKSEALFIQIVRKRQKMVEIGGKTGLSSEETITCSQELDQLLTLYQKQLLREEEDRTSITATIGRFLSFSKS
jgi:stage 0 sporulation regulatory protein